MPRLMAIPCFFHIRWTVAGLTYNFSGHIAHVPAKAYAGPAAEVFQVPGATAPPSRHVLERPRVMERLENNGLFSRGGNGFAFLPVRIPELSDSPFLEPLPPLDYGGSADL